ncbi:pentapeptide repeat-containing protein [Planktothrix mougeotii]|uniref:Pentapeptide repeat-containing protein n=1 Tax=Planktothrix mougeotii LEGE 06226 TaxID=1828728 RepID=A0ABR9UDW4_9CYAN|nr:pentapeptide repeat-containing protein [Planktothrix mougeotii]MBE9144612.1 pentapeptide repeat-containing protein [Planktothrix mougeotii LEGE 06226]
MITPGELNYYYKVLDLKPGASLELVDQAYKDLAFIWHPDRIPEENQRLRKIAEEKLKEINQAREKLRSLLRRSSSNSTQRSSTVQRSESYPKSSSNGAGYSTSQTYQRPASSYQSQTYKTNVKTSENGNFKRPPTPVNSQPKTPPSPPPPPPKPTELSGLSFKGEDLKERDFSSRNLSGADFSEANLSDAFLHKVNLSGACLYKANLFRANFLQANLTYANLQEANLIGADLSGADLRCANLTGAKVGIGDKIMVKLTGAKLQGAILPDGSVHPQ